MPKKILFTGGGTVGHVTLNLILIPKFIKDGWEVHYIGDKNGIEHTEIEKSVLDVTFHAIATGKLRRYFSWQNLADVFKVALASYSLSLLLPSFALKPFFPKVVLSQYRQLWLLNCLVNQSLFMNQIGQWD